MSSLLGCCTNGVFRHKAWTYQVIECAEGWAVSIESVKQHLRLPEGNDDDTYITSLIQAATIYVEQETKRDLIKKKYRTYRDCFPPYITARCREEGIQLRRMLLKKSAGVFVPDPKDNITLFQYLVDGVLTDVPTADWYVTDEKNFGSIFLVNGKSWPTDIDNRHQAIKIEFLSGFGTSEEDIPESIRIAILHIVADLFENRGDCSIDGGGCVKCAIGGIAHTMLQQWRIMEIGC